MKIKNIYEILFMTDPVVEIKFDNGDLDITVFAISGRNILDKFNNEFKNGKGYKVSFKFEFSRVIKITSSLDVNPLKSPTKEADSTLIEIENSDWYTEFPKISDKNYTLSNCHHYILYIPENGLYEVLADDVKISVPTEAI